MISGTISGMDLFRRRRHLSGGTARLHVRKRPNPPNHAAR